MLQLDLYNLFNHFFLEINVGINQHFGLNNVYNTYNMKQLWIYLFLDCQFVDLNKEICGKIDVAQYVDNIYLSAEFSLYKIKKK